MEITALVGGTIYPNPTEEAIRDGIVLIQDGKITAADRRTSLPVPQGAQVLDCSGRAITAGFWNSHIHFFERKWANVAEIPGLELSRQLQDMLTRYGFTSVFDIGSMWENTRQLRERIESGEVAGPRIRTTGEGLIPPNATPPEIVMQMMGTMNVPLPEVADPAQATAACRKLLAQGVDAIKLFISSPRSPSLSEDTIHAAVNEAHNAGKLAFAHPNRGTDVLAAARAGVDIIAHTTPHSGPWDETILEAMAKAGTALTPTLTIWKNYARHDRISAQEKIVDTEVGQLRAWLALNGTVLFGNDLGAVDYDPTEEYMLMAAAGMGFRQVLASLTTAPAERIGESARLGRIEPGLAADVVVLKRDPSENIRALAAVEYTLRAGKIIYRASE